MLPSPLPVFIIASPHGLGGGISWGRAPICSLGSFITCCGKVLINDWRFWKASLESMEQINPQLCPLVPRALDGGAQYSQGDFICCLQVSFLWAL